MRLAACTLLAASLFAALAAGPGAASAAPPPPIPVLAYYYIWFTPSSWYRAKTDYPLLGRYSSDERIVMRQHVSWAKHAGIDGFIVSWKSTPLLDERLEKLRGVAAKAHFKLAVIYQGLDFERRPLPASRVEHDLDALLDRYGSDPVFRLADGKPLVIWSGTWAFSRAAVRQIAHTVGDRASLLASEKDVEGYERLADLVDGDAYYWSSVNPKTYPGYTEKLRDMSAAIHAHRGLWIAPAAPGFDARLVGGKTVVPRAHGQTLRRELDAAFSSSPDAVGVISWNEFSENTHLEPSEHFGPRFLKVLAEVLGAEGPTVSNFDSDAPAATGTSHGLPLLLGTAAFIVAGLLIGARRRSGGRGDDDRRSDDAAPLSESNAP